ncbi:hypothetical protein Ait01nite_084560 [Actinoplanes italicus]|nr:hypothetical protein Ait01nite_084560 [Actinoplanes italicus]
MCTRCANAASRAAAPQGRLLSLVGVDLGHFKRMTFSGADEATLTLRTDMKHRPQISTIRARAGRSKRGVRLPVQLPRPSAENWVDRVWLNCRSIVA